MATATARGETPLLPGALPALLAANVVVAAMWRVELARSPSDPSLMERLFTFDLNRSGSGSSSSSSTRVAALARSFASVFSHRRLSHLATNSAFLWVVWYDAVRREAGRCGEDRLKWWMPSVYVAGGWFGNLASTAFHTYVAPPTTHAKGLGSSGAVLSLFAFATTYDAIRASHLRRHREVGEEEVVTATYSTTTTTAAAFRPPRGLLSPDATRALQVNYTHFLLGVTLADVVGLALLVLAPIALETGLRRRGRFPFVATTSSSSSMDHAAHLGGVAFGTMSGILYSSSKERDSEEGSDVCI